MGDFGGVPAPRAAKRARRVERQERPRVSLSGCGSDADDAVEAALDAERRACLRRILETPSRAPFSSPAAPEPAPPTSPAETTTPPPPSPLEAELAHLRERLEEAHLRSAAERQAHTDAELAWHAARDELEARARTAEREARALRESAQARTLDFAAVRETSEDLRARCAAVREQAQSALLVREAHRTEALQRTPASSSSSLPSPPPHVEDATAASRAALLEKLRAAEDRCARAERKAQSLRARDENVELLRERLDAAHTEIAELRALSARSAQLAHEAATARREREEWEGSALLAEFGSPTAVLATLADLRGRLARTAEREGEAAAERAAALARGSDAERAAARLRGELEASRRESAALAGALASARRKLLSLRPTAAPAAAAAAGAGKAFAGGVAGGRAVVDPSAPTARILHLPQPASLSAAPTSALLTELGRLRQLEADVRASRAHEDITSARMIEQYRLLAQELRDLVRLVLGFSISRADGACWELVPVFETRVTPRSAATLVVEKARGRRDFVLLNSEYLERFPEIRDAYLARPQPPGLPDGTTALPAFFSALVQALYRRYL